MNRHTVTSFTLALVAVIFFAAPDRFLKTSQTAGQRRRPATKPRPQPPPNKVAIDYTKFSHATKQHQAACKTCHQAPTANWQKARGFPDVADFPGHAACVSCHRQQFFKGAAPAICSDCHTRVSPRDDARFAFRNPARARQFKIEFPHDKHQDVIARMQHEVPPLAAFELRQVSFSFGQGPADQPKKNYNNCTICHATNTLTPAAPASGWVDQFVPVAETFKSVPAAHAACFNCHWKGQEPTRENCGGCHKLAAPFVPSSVPTRISMKFKHSREQHIAECTTCHINITKSATLRGLKPDVPITGCTECHNKEGLRTDLSKELVAIDKNRDFVCGYCHTSDVGKRDPPPGHYVVAERPPLLRKDVK
jgi:Class III cytochrome C family